MRAVLTFNAGSGSAPDPDELRAALRARGVELVEELPAAELLEGGRPQTAAERLIVVGGDGTVAPAAELAARAGVALAVVAAGTANDFARAHGLPLDLDAGLALAARPDAGLRPLELARMDGRPFVNVASIGLATAAARRAEPLKRALGPLAYSAGAALAGALEPPLRVQVTTDGERAFDGEAWQVTVASSGAFGGGAEVGRTNPHDGDLDLVVVPAGRRVALPGIGLAMRRGTLAHSDGVLHRRAGAIELHVPDGSAFNVDGELVPAHGSTRFGAHAAAFELVVPA